MTHRYLYCIASALLVVALILAAYAFYQVDEPIAGGRKIATQYDFVSVAGPIQPIPHIKTIDKQWFSLGKALFNSTLLSKDNTVSCASCHLVGEGGDDGFPVSVGIGGSVGERNSPTVLNAVFNFRQFWDGRSAGLAEQAVGPIHNPIEMNSNFAEIIQKLNQSDDFSQAFSVLSPDGITQEAIIQALVTFEEGLITPDAAIDRFIKGDKSALTVQQKRGYEKFIGFGCVSCHQGVNIGGNLYQRLGRIDSVPSHLLEDKGRSVITNNAADEHVFKVPSLRNIKRTGPYFHDGSVATLDEAVRIMAQGQLGIALEDSDVKDLLSLFDAFNGELH